MTIEATPKEIVDLIGYLRKPYNISDAVIDTKELGERLEKALQEALIKL